MRIPRPFIVLLGFLFVCVLSITPAEMHNGTLSSAPVNSPPVAGDDTYTRHGNGVIGPLRQNDSDPDGDPMTVQLVTFPTHGNLSGLDGNSFHYSLTNQSFIGTDTFTYRACDNQSACSNVATVTINVVNQAPIAGDDSYTVHGITTIGPMMVNDFDPDGDSITWNLVTAPAHGSLFGLAQQDLKSYTPHQGYTGPDSFTYKMCDQFSLCSLPATVSLNVVNNPPVPGPDSYVVRGSTIIGPLRVNDFDPDGDSLGTPSLVVAASHGSVFGLTDPDFKQYVPHAGYTGTDTFQYQLTDSLGGTGTTTVTLYVIGEGEDNGLCSACPGLGGPVAVGNPINVTNGNMYLQQHDYSLPGVGSSLDLSRTYNSDSQSIGLFGRGWSTAYDESIISYDSSTVRFNQADGRAIYFGRPSGSSGAFTPLVGDFHGQLSQDANGFTLTMKDGSIHQFDPAGKLISLADLDGNATTLTYVAGLLTTITDATGRVLSVTTDANGRVLSISDTLGMIATYTYGASNQLISVTYPDNSAFQFAYNGSLRLTSVTDALGNVLESHTYDGQGRALTSAKHGGVELYTLNYVSDTQTDVTDALGRVTKYTIDKSKGRNVVTRVEGLCSCGGGGSQVQTWTYDSQLNVTAKTDALNHISTFTYDTNGNRLTETDPTGTVTYTYNQLGEVLTRTDQLNGVTTNTYDSSGNLLTTADALNNTSTFTYNTRGQVLTATDARSKVTTFTYDAAGNLTQQRDANNVTTFFFYDARGRITKVRDGLSRSTLYTYDPAGRPNKVTHPDLSFMTFTYDLAGRRSVVTDERGNPTTYAYDSAYRLTTVTDALSHPTSYGYDTMSNQTSMTDALGRVTDYEYDDFNRLKKTIYPPAVTGGPRLFETVGYDAAGNVTQRTDTAGRVSNVFYDNVNRVLSSTDPDNKTTSFEYDALSRTTAVVDALNQRYEFAYDLVGRQTGLTRAGVSMSYQYDAAGNRTQRTDYNGVVTNYTYDNLNRLTTVTYPARTATYAYDPLNNMTRTTNENGSVYISYDNRYRVSSFSDPFYYGVSYNYDATGNRTKLKLNGATYATYTYDAVNRLTNLADSANQNFPHSYDDVNRLTARSAPNGVTSSYTYDGLRRLTALNHSTGAGTLIGNQYQYNDANNITNWTNASGNHAYGYDLVNRLSSATNSAQPNENYSYDGVGNRTTSHLSASYSYQPFNKLTSTAAASYTYDNNGNLLSKTDASGTTTFTWNEENQLTQVTLPSSLTVNYKYDGLGRRLQRTTSAGANERYVYDGADVLLDLNADWSVANTYLNGSGIDNHLRQTNTTTGASYFLTDQLGSTSALTDASGALVEQLAYDSFGNSAGSTRTRYGYTGRERDPDTGLLYYRARWQDPQVGRFISEDPIGFLGRDVNVYGYVSNDPLRMIDPSGLRRRCHPLVGALLGGAFGAGVGAGTGGILGGLAAGTIGAVGGSFVIPGFGTIGGGAIGIGVGVNAGAAFGAAIGAGIGIAAGIDYCNTEVCDPAPQAAPIPFPFPDSIPMPPPPMQLSRGWTCKASCNIENFSRIPNAPDRVEGVGSGHSQEAACRSAKAAAVAGAPLGTYGRHCKCFDCVKN
ncbi:MAG TPA: Ig-like domain-containing protein [Pyrinomonadaceae bacterium]|nr:Ig-like domain-containing protein [Pyrinomonadaceae bacterium]